jgi:hypothetical protein
MSTAKLLSMFTFVGIVILILLSFGFTWKILGAGIVVSAILSIIYYIVVKKSI